MTIPPVSGGGPTIQKLSKDDASAFTERLRSLMVRMETVCNCGGEAKIAVCDQTLSTLTYALTKGKQQTVNSTLKELFTVDKLKELAVAGKLDKTLVLDIKRFSEDLGKVVPLDPLTPDVTLILQQALDHPGWIKTEDLAPKPTQPDRHPPEISKHDSPKPALPISEKNTAPVTQKTETSTLSIHATAEPVVIPKQLSPKDTLAKLATLPEAAPIITPELLKKGDTDKSVFPPKLTEPLDLKTKSVLVVAEKVVLPTHTEVLNEKTGKQSTLFLENTATPNRENRDIPLTARVDKQDQPALIHPQRQDHTPKTMATSSKIIALVMEKAPPALEAVKQNIHHIAQNPPQEAEAKMNSMANIIAHVGRADTEQLKPTMALLTTVLQLPSETITTLGHSLSLVAKQQPEHLPVILSLFQEMPLQPKVLTAVAHLLLECLETIPVPTNGQKNSPPQRAPMLPALATALITVAKADPAHTHTTITTFSTVAQTMPNTLPDIAKAISTLVHREPHIVKPILQLIQTLITTQPEHTPKLSTALLTMSKTAPPQQVSHVLQLITMTTKESPNSVPLLLDLVTASLVTQPSQQGAMRPSLQKAETATPLPLFRQIESTSQRILEPSVQRLSLPTHPQRTAATDIPQLKAQKTLDTTLTLLSHTLKTRPETLPLLMAALHKTGETQPTQQNRILQIFQTLSQAHPTEVSSISKAILQFGQTHPPHVDKAMTLLLHVVKHTPAHVAPLVQALETISLFPQAIQKDAVTHLHMVAQKSPKTFESTCTTIAKVTENQKQSAPTSRQTEAPRNSKTSEPTAARGQGPEKEAPIPATQKKSDTPMTTSNKPAPTSQPVPETATHGKPTTANHMAQRLALFGQISAHSPRDLAATRMTVATITTKAPAALGQTFVAISAVGTHTPQHLAAALTLLSAIADKAPAALAQVATTLSGIATHAPQHLAAVVTLLSAIADKAPAALAQVATTLSGIATHAPQHLAAVVTLLSAIADKASPELFKMILEIGQKMATKAPDLLPKLSQFLIQLHEHSPIDKLHNQLLALMHALAAEASEENTLLLQKLLTLGELKAAEDPALHAYVSAEIKKTRDKAKKAREGKLAKQSSTDQLIQMFDHMEMENWKLAAMFRKSLQLSQTS